MAFFECKGVQPEHFNQGSPDRSLKRGSRDKTPSVQRLRRDLPKVDFWLGGLPPKTVEQARPSILG
nr:hypothetical protein A152_02160 [Vibrio tasmaniensis 1F-187]